MRKHAIWVALVLAAGCNSTSGTDGGTGNERGPNVPDLPPAPAGLVTTKAAGQSAEADFSSAAQYLIVPYSVSEQASEAIEFTVSIKSSSGMGQGTYPLRYTPAQRPAMDPALAARWQQRLKVEGWLRSVAEKSSRMQHSLPRNLTMPLAGADCTTSDKCDQNEVCSALKCASQLTIKTASFSSTPSITVNVKAKGKKAAILLDSAATMDDSTANAILQRFESIILPRDVALFGDPPLQGTSGTTASDRNADGLVWLVMTPKVQDKKAVGFFVATDFTDDANSNKADILYIDPSGKQEDIYATSAHEYQHLLNYGSKVYKPKVNGGTGALEALWLDEGQAHFAEDACGFGGENTTLLRQNVFPDFSDKSVLFTTDDLSARGMAFLYVRYLFEQKGAVTYGSDGSISDVGGASFLKALHSSTLQGAANVNAAIKPVFSDWKAGFDGWMAAMSLDGRGLTDFARYIYQPLQKDPAGAHNEIGVKIRGARTDNTGTSVNLTGPTETDATVGDTPDKVPNASGKFFLLKNQTGKLTVTVTSKDQDFRFAVIKLSK